MNLRAVRQALADAVSVIPGMSCYSFVPNAPNVPAFMVCETDVAYDRHSFGGTGDEATVTCRILVSKADDMEGQAALDQYLGRGDYSIKLAIEAARGAPGEAALDGAADDLHVIRLQGYRIYEHFGDEFYGAEIIVRVIGEGDGE